LDIERRGIEDVGERYQFKPEKGLISGNCKGFCAEAEVLVFQEELMSRFGGRLPPQPCGKAGDVFLPLKPSAPTPKAIEKELNRQ
jgi:hypothetical protein